MRGLFRWSARLALGFVVSSFAAVLLFRFVAPPLTPLMVTRAIGSAIGGHAVGVDQHWVDLGDISPELMRAVIASEDARFFSHHGFDLVELERAWKSNQRRGQRLRGASTITMQCARNLFLWQGRTWPRKVLEAWFTLLLELTWSKRRILEVYLNVIEWGPGIYGADAAASRYFALPPSRLGVRQASLLAAALPSPLHSNPAAPSRSLEARAARIRARMADVDLAPLAKANRHPRTALRTAAADRPLSIHLPRACYCRPRDRTDRARRR